MYVYVIINNVRIIYNDYSSKYAAYATIFLYLKIKYIMLYYLSLHVL